MTDTAIRIAMWSGPRNISTAMMRAFENRPDCTVSDEPLYGAWLAMTGADHPMRETVIAAMETDWARVTDTLTGPVPNDHPVWYQKHMTHHLLPEMMQRDWLSGLTHTFLIRSPEAVVTSYLKKRDTASPEDIGVPQQARLYDYVRGELGQDPPVMDSGEFLENPQGHLRALCNHLGITFMPEMLSWPEGPRASDGPWAPHWYRNVWRSTGFQRPRAKRPVLDARAARVAEACRPAYERLYARRLEAEL